MENSAHIGIHLNKNDLSLKLVLNGKKYWWDENIEQPQMDPQELVFWLIMNRIKPVFYSMPFTNFTVNHSKEAVDKYGNKIQQILFVLDRMNKLLSKYSHLKGVAENHENVLLYNVDEAPTYKQLFKHLKEKNYPVLYENMSSGFDGETRQWKDIGVPIPIDSLLGYLVENKIKKLIAINMYLIEKYLFKEGLYLPGVFDFMGVELVGIEQDECDLGSWSGQYYRNFFNNDKCVRYSNVIYTSSYWDNYFKQTNNIYINSLKNCDPTRPKLKINKDYKILFLTNSRIQNTKSLVPSFLYIMENMDANEIFSSFQLWFVSLRYMILNIMNLNVNEKLACNSRLFGFFYNCYQILKYETIANIQTSRPIEIYGDKGWGALFPEYYQNKYLSGKDLENVLNSQDYLLIIPNWSISWFSRDFNLYDSLINDVPFITAASIAMPEKFHHLKKIEFSTPTELNHLIDNVENVYNDDQLMDSIFSFKRLLHENYEKACQGMMSDQPLSFDYGNNSLLIDESKDILSKRIHDYIDNNEAFLRASFDVLFKGSQINFNMPDCRLYNRPYIQTLLKS